MKKVFIGLGIFIGMMCIFAGVMFIGLTQNMKTIRAEEIHPIDVTTYEDQTLRGAYYFEGQIGATVDVEIKDGKITNITFVDHQYGLGGKAEIITEDIIREQSLDVDAITSATTSSHIIKLAVQNALEEKE